MIITSFITITIVTVKDSQHRLCKIAVNFSLTYNLIIIVQKLYFLFSNSQCIPLIYISQQT